MTRTQFVDGKPIFIHS